MMIANPDRNYMSAEEYLEWEESQPLKYEYMEGEVFAMTGGTVSHAMVAANIFYQLKTRLRGGSCRPFIFDAKVGVSESGPFHYPDVMVSCDERDKNAKQVIYYPSLIVEVLSPSTEAFDRGKKFRNYRRIPTLREYVLVSADQKIVECFRLNERGVWELATYGEGDEVELTSIDFRFPIELIYEDVVLEEASEGESESDR